MAEGLFEDLPEGDIAAAGSKIVPIKLIQNISKAFGREAQGLVTQTGEPLMKAEDFTWGDFLWTAGGFQTTETSMFFDKRSRAYGKIGPVEEKRSELLREYAQAEVGRDRKAARRAKDEINAFNKRNKHARISFKSMRDRVKSLREERGKRDAGTGIVVDDRNRRVLDSAY